MAEDKGYTVKDKRKLGSEDTPPAEEGKGEKKVEEAGATCDESTLFTELGFSTFILSLSTSALVHLGELPDPITDNKQTNLPLARQTISIIELLKEKTKGNLTEDEERLIESLLYDLRIKYVKLAC
jgi:hypothetical protein